MINLDRNPKSGEGKKTYKVIEIVKRNNMAESTESVNNLIETPTHTSTRKSIFATLIKRNAPRGPKVQITKQIETCSRVNADSDEEESDEEVAHFRVSAEYYQQPKTSSDESVPPRRRQYNFLQKIMKRRVMSSGDFKEDRKKCEERFLMELARFVPTTYMPKYDIKLINSIQELRDILQNLHQSEDHLVYLLKRYILDKSFEKQLMKASAEFFGLQYDAKSQTNILANELWMQQLEETKMEQFNYQQKITFLVKTNRSLQFQIEMLSRHCEKLADRTNLYSKRFLHMRSIGKTYSRHLIENNKKLQSKVKALTEIVEEFEEELQKCQMQKSYTENENRNFKTQIYQLETLLDKQISSHELEKTSLIARFTTQTRLINDCEQACRYFFQDLIEMEHQAREIDITFSFFPNFSYQDACLAELIYQLRACACDFIATLIEEYAGILSVAKDVDQLRNTNARLQENLHKSTNELDNLSKKFEQTGSQKVDKSCQCYNLHQENSTLKVKLEVSKEANQKLEEELATQKRLLQESTASVDKFSSESVALTNQIDEILQLVEQLEQENEFPKECKNQEKLEHFRLRYTQAVTERKHLNERCNSLEEEQQNLLQSHQMFQHDLGILQEAVNILSAENESVKKQMAAEHQTVISLQNERIKYLEEKNILKTVFQHLKSEVSRIHQLESAVADMSKETNRLALIAEFNKQLGEHLKGEVEVKDHTILELKQSLEKLSHVQHDNDKEKLSLCAQLSEISTVKDKLTDCLEMELKKNMHLDESRKKLETTTKSQLKVYEEMQKNERAALKELLRDFKGLIKQRDSLVHAQEESKKKYHKVEQHLSELQDEYKKTICQVNEKDEIIKQLNEKLEKQEEQLKQHKEDSQADIAKHEKSIRKLEKLLGQMRSEKGELEASNTYLKTNLQKAHNEFNEARQKEKDAANELAVKFAENTTLQAEITSYKNDLQEVNQENGKLKIEVQYLSKMYEKQASELNNIVAQFSSKGAEYQTSLASLTSKDQQIAELSKLVSEVDNRNKQLEQETDLLKKQIEDQNKVMCAYENQLVMLQDVEASKLQLEKELSNIEQDKKIVQNELDKAKKEVERLRGKLKAQADRNEDEKSFYKNQASDLILEYNEQKEDIEAEIDSIANQLSKVTDSLNSEKMRFEQLSKSNDDLKERFIKMKEALSAEVKAHQETCHKLQETDNILKNLGEQKEKLQQQIGLLTMALNREREANLQLSDENKRLQMIFEQGRQQFGAVVTARADLDAEVKELHLEVENLKKTKQELESEIKQTATKVQEKNAELKAAQDNIHSLRNELAESQKTVFDMKEEFFKLQQQITGLEFKNCELTLQIHEAQTKLETERNLCKELQDFKSDDEEAALLPSINGEQFY